MAAVEEISMDAAIALVLSELGGIFIFKEEQNNVTEEISGWTIFLVLYYFGHAFSVKHS